MRLSLAALIVLLAVSHAATAGVKVAADGKATVGIQAAPADNEKVKEAAEVLAAYLKGMTGAEFEVGKGDGILVALAADEAVSEGDRGRLAKMGPEAHMIRVGEDKLSLVGNSEKAVLNACFSLLDRLGCRWLIPGDRWTVVPKHNVLEIPDLELFDEPDFAYRSVWYAYGMGVDPSKEVLKRDYERWFVGNRLGGVAPYKCGHTYPHTVGKHKEEFQAHPEYFAMDGKGNRAKFSTSASLCYSNPEVAKLFIADKTEELRASKAENPYSYTVSMDPNDGSRECHCEACKALGNGSDQCLYLANQVAKALRQEFADAVVTFYVYASHRLPPTKVKAEANINVQVAMGFNKTQYTLPELVRLWRDVVPAVGIRDYLGVMAWDWGLPGRGRASSFPYVRENIPQFKEWGATSYNAEINANWGSFGPATYVATRLLWDAKADANAAYDDFFAQAFGPAGPEMRKLHALWRESSKLTRQNLHIWFRQFNRAWEAGKDASPGVRARLIDMASYLHYVRLYADWQTAKQTKLRERGYEALKPLLEFTWRTRERQVVHAYALQRRLVNSGDSLVRPLDPGWQFSDPKAVWKHPESLTDAQLEAIYLADLKATPADSRMRMFSRDLKPFNGRQFGKRPVGAMRFNTNWYALVEDEKHLKFTLPMEGVRYSYKLTVCDLDGNEVWTTGREISEGSRYERHKFTLDVQFPKPGLYRITFNAGEDYRPDWPMDLKVVLEVSEASHPMFRMYGDAYFFVPKDTKSILMKTNSRFSLRAPSWRGRVDLSAANEDRELGCIVVPVGDDAGKAWAVTSQTAGNCYFLNIPTYLAPSPAQLLIPAECVEGAKDE